MNVLQVYLAKPFEIKDLFPKASIDLVSLTQLKESGLGQRTYDAIYCAHVLQCVEPGEVPALIGSLVNALADRGELWILTPSLEWAMAQALSEQPDPLINYVLFGNADYPHRSAYALVWLRALVENCGLIPRRATQEPYSVTNQDGQKRQLPANLVIGWKVLQ